MTVTIKLQKPDGSQIAGFIAEDRQSIAQLAKANGVNFPTSCGIGSCGVCKCKIVAWNQYVQIDKISPPLRPLERDENGNFKEILACIGGIASDAIKDKEDHDVILEKNM